MDDAEREQSLADFRAAGKRRYDDVMTRSVFVANQGGSMEGKQVNALPVAIILLLVLPVLYVGSYLALVTAEPLGFMTGPGPWRKRAVYRYGDATSQRIFFPINWIDRRLRVDFWQHSIEEEPW